MISALMLTLALLPLNDEGRLKGAWQTHAQDGTTGTMIVTDDHFSIAWYRTEPARFIATMGGEWSLDNGDSRVKWEFYTSDPRKVGTSETVSIELSHATLRLGEHEWRRLDDGTQGALEGAWLITGRKRDGEIRTSRPGARRTMKIVSGTRFQWIAYNVETREFFGTGGGTYTTDATRYTENLEFFSRDDGRAGASLPFTYELIDGAWHHSGMSSNGRPLYEVWSRRSDLAM